MTEYRSEDQKSYLLSSFYWGYAAGQLPAIALTKWLPSKNVFAFSIILASIFTILLPAFAAHSYVWCLTLRCLTGLAESAAFPAAFCLYNSWVPSSERTVMITVVMAGLYMVPNALITYYTLWFIN